MRDWPQSRPLLGFGLNRTCASVASIQGGDLRFGNNGSNANASTLSLNDGGGTAANTSITLAATDAAYNINSPLVVTNNGYSELVPASVPEPGTYALALLGGAGLLGAVRRGRAARLRV